MNEYLLISLKSGWVPTEIAEFSIFDLSQPVNRLSVWGKKFPTRTKVCSQARFFTDYGPCILAATMIMLQTVNINKVTKTCKTIAIPLDLLKKRPND